MNVLYRYLVNPMQNQARSTSWDSATHPSIAIDVLVTPGVGDADVCVVGPPHRCSEGKADQDETCVFSSMSERTWETVPQLSLHRKPGKKVTIPIYKVLRRPSWESNSRLSSTTVRKHFYVRKIGCDRKNANMRTAFNWSN